MYIKRKVQYTRDNNLIKVKTFKIKKKKVPSVFVAWTVALVLFLAILLSPLLLIHV